MSKQPSVHNPSNFDPANYEIQDYLDNKRPQFFGQDEVTWKNEIEWWEADMRRAFGPDWVKKIHRCVHCGNTNVRWITAVKHAPTGDVVTFGADCTERLGFANRQDWKLAQLKSKAEAKHGRIKIWKARVAYLEANPEIAAAVEQAKGEAHAKNYFVQDVLRKLDQYGSLSERQAAAVLSSLKRDIESAERKAAEAVEVKGEAPEGRVEVVGAILSIQDRETDFGVVTKALLKLANNAKVWLTLPSEAIGSVERGDVIKVRATFERSRDDRSFGFGKRPTFLGKEAA